MVIELATIACQLGSLRCYGVFLPVETDPQDIQVAIALVERSGEWLVAQRAAGRIFAGLWEFPGGKIEPGETPAMAAVRETQEETHLKVQPVGELGSIVTQDADRRVILHLIRCTVLAGEAGIGDGAVTQVRWVRGPMLQQLDMPPANAAIIARLHELIERRTPDTASQTIPCLPGCTEQKQPPRR